MANEQADWDAIEREYRAGRATIVAIARTYGVSRSAIMKRAAKHSWERAAPPPKPEPAEPTPHAKTGRPTEYQDSYAEQATKLYALGATDIEVADFLGVTVRTLYTWLHLHPAFLQAAKAGKDACDDRVERSLYHRAVGYSHEAVKVFQYQGQAVVVPYREHVPPDVSAATLWLKIRRKDVWRDRQEHEHCGRDGGPIETRDVTDEDRVKALELFLIRHKIRKPSTTGEPTNG